jgi:hypothetical protein
MPIYNSKDNDILAALEETYRAMQEAKIVVSPGGKMGRDDKEWGEQKGPDISGNDAGAPDPRTPEQKISGDKEQDRIARRAKHKAPDTKKTSSDLRGMGVPPLKAYKVAMDRSPKKGKTQTEKGSKIPNTIKKKK